MLDLKRIAQMGYKGTIDITPTLTKIAAYRTSHHWIWVVVDYPKL